MIDLGDASAPEAIDRACRDVGFFALARHGIPGVRREAVLAAARRFFALEREAKDAVSLASGGAAWRGWFPLGDELTSGIPDLKEGFYVGRELPPSGIPLHGPNVWPAEVPELRTEVTWWMGAMEALGRRTLAAMAEGLGLSPTWFADGLTADPTVLFRIFRYPPHPSIGELAAELAGSPELAGTAVADPERRWGVAEHTDYGLLTLLAHDGTPGLEVRVGDRWVAVDPDPELIVCNLGDMLDRLTLGRYRSTPHRVRNTAAQDRISLPFFLDPSWDAVIEPLPLAGAWDVPADRARRWDGADLTRLHGTYGDWLLAKVRRVFPSLATTVLD